MLRIIALTALLLLSVSAESYSQCCAAGNPLNTGSSMPGGSRNILDASVLYIHSLSDTYYEGTSVSDYRYIDNSSFDYSMLMLKYGLTSDLQITAELGYFFSKMQDFIQFSDGFNPPSRKAYGLADGAIGVIYKLYSDDDGLFSINPNFKVTLPVGVFDQADGPVVMPIDIQPSSGNFKYNFGLSLFKGFEKSDIALMAIGNYEISQRIETERTNYKYGNQFNVSLIGLYNLSSLFGESDFLENLTGSLEFRANLRDKSSDRQKKLIESTGGTVLFVAPHLAFAFAGDWGVNMQFEVPIYKDINGIQLTNKYAFTFGISKRFDFGGDGEPIQSEPDTKQYEHLAKAEFRVEGNCEMCKERIEKVVRGFDNVAYADWNMDTKFLLIRFDKYLNIEALKKAIANAGHDTDLFKADDGTYSKLPKCCLYRK
jgi:hypothetical protein